MRNVMVLLLTMCWLMSAGCEQKAPSRQSGNIAVVDMDQIAMSTGFDKALGEQMMKINSEIGAHLKQAQEKIRTDLETRQQAMGENPTDKQKSDFEQYSYELDQQYRQEINKAQQASNQAHTSMIGQFRQQITPIAQDVARAQGFDIVMTRTDAMLLVSPAADITQDVLAMFKQSGLGSMPIQPRGMLNSQSAPAAPAVTPTMPTPAPTQEPASATEDQAQEPSVIPPTNQLPVQ